MSNTLSAEARVFGFEATSIELSVIPRSTRWRAVRAGAFTGCGIVIAPVVAIFPPHVAWALGALVTGAFLGWRKWTERLTLVDVDGCCPRCGSTYAFSGASRLRPRFGLGCPGCHHDAQIEVHDFPA